MTTYCITAARPNDAEHHLNTEFMLWRFRPGKVEPWLAEGWTGVDIVVAHLAAGHEVLTAKRSAKGIRTGAAVEVVLRISENDADFPISEMPDE